MVSFMSSLNVSQEYRDDLIPKKEDILEISICTIDS